MSYMIRFYYKANILDEVFLKKGEILNVAEQLWRRIIAPQDK